MDEEVIEVDGICNHLDLFVDDVGCDKPKCITPLHGTNPTSMISLDTFSKKNGR